MKYFLISLSFIAFVTFSQSYFQIVNQDIIKALVFTIILTALLIFLGIKGLLGPLHDFLVEDRTKTGGFIWMLIVYSFLAYGIVVMSNDLLSRNPAQTHLVTVLGVGETTGRNSHHRWVRVVSWRDPNRTQEIDSSRRLPWKFLESLSPGDTIAVDTRTGALGLETLVSARKALKEEKIH